MLKMLLLNLLVNVAKMRQPKLLYKVMCIHEALLAKFAFALIFQTILNRRFPLSIIIIIIILNILQ